jgi:hypothetical protein
MSPLQTMTLAGICRTPIRAEGGQLHAVLAGILLFKQLSGISDYIIRANKLDFFTVFFMQFFQMRCIFTYQTFLKPFWG